MFDDYFIQEEFIFPEHGGVTGTRNVGCPCCEARYELAVDEGNTADTFRCDSCGNTFEVDWVDGTVRHKVPLNGPGYSGNHHRWRRGSNGNPGRLRFSRGRSRLPETADGDSRRSAGPGAN